MIIYVQYVTLSI